jgi:hypothetical protein
LAATNTAYGERLAEELLLLAAERTGRKKGE